LTDNITKKYKDELIENKARAKVISTILGLPADKVYEPDNISDKMYG